MRPGLTVITSVRLRNFKNFADETLRLGPFTVIVGANASGKSNIRDAFRFLHGVGRGYALAEIVGGVSAGGARSEWEPIRGATNEVARLGESGFALEATIDLSSRKAEMREFLRIFGNPESPTPDEASYVIRVGYDESCEQVFSIAGTAFRANRGYAWERPEDWRRGDGLSLAGQGPLPDYFPGQNPKAPLLSAEFQSAFLGIRFLDPAPDLMRRPSFPGQTTLGDGGGNLPTVLQEICEDKNLKAVLTDWIRELTPMDIAEFRFPRDPSGRVHLVMREESGREVSAYSASDGTLRFLAILAALLGPNPADLYFIEEIESGIHPSRLHLLLELVERQTGKGRIQVVATTHSPALLTATGDRTFENASVVCRLPCTTDAVIRPLCALPNARKLRDEQGLGRLLEGGWMETAIAFTEDERGGEERAE